MVKKHIDRARRALGNILPGPGARKAPSGPKEDLIRELMAGAHAGRGGSADDRASRLDSVTAEIDRLLPARRGPEHLQPASTPAELLHGPRPDVLGLIVADVARRELIIPYRFDEGLGTVFLAVARTPNAERDSAYRQMLRLKTGRAVEPSYWTHPDQQILSELISRWYGSPDDKELAHSTEALARRYAEAEPATSAHMHASPDQETRKFILDLLRNAYLGGVNDVKILPTHERTLIKYKENSRSKLPAHLGNIHFPTATAAYLVRIIKQLCTPEVPIHILDAPQKGTLTLAIPTEDGKGTKWVEGRVSLTPGPWGQTCIIRLFQDESVPTNFFEIVDDPFTQHHMVEAIQKSRPMLVIAAPPGEGKSTILHAAYSPPILDTVANDVFSIETPIERRRSDWVQWTPTEKAPMEKLLEDSLQSSPDYLIVGEATSPKAADTLLHASVTAIPVATTVHAKSAPLAIHRLLDLGMDRKRLAVQLDLIVATRLIPRVCPECKGDPLQITPELHAWLRAEQFFEEEIAVATIFDPRGCALCEGTGLRGKKAVFETLHVTPRAREIIAEEPLDLIDEYLRAELIVIGSQPLRRAVIAQVVAGVAPRTALHPFPYMTELELDLWRRQHRPTWRASVRLLTSRSAHQAE